MTALAGCSNASNSGAPSDAGGDDVAAEVEFAPDVGADAADATLSAPPPQISITARDTRFVAREHMLAAVEMQLSGEPFAEAFGRDLTKYHRDVLPPDLYFGTIPGQSGFVDLPGFSTAVESYEYSKQPMNNVSFESGAGPSLAYGAVMNPSGATGATACGLLRAFTLHAAGASNATGSALFSTTASPTNPLGWPGLWPTTVPFESFDPTIAPTTAASLGCSITSDDDPGAGNALISDDYECDTNQLHLPNRAAQVDAAITPGSAGWAGWKAMLWVLNYLQVMHDANETAVQTVAPADLAKVGVPGNTVAPLTQPDGTIAKPAPGVYLGSSNIEGFQAATMIAEIDSAAVGWLTQWSTTDGKTLSGFADLSTALKYDTGASLRWFPAEVKVTETSDPDCPFPRPTGWSVRDGGSHLLDVAGLLGAYASAFALTDTANSTVGGAQTYRAFFDGDPFPVQTAGGGLDQTPTGSATLHDRSLAVMRVALVDFLRMHVDPDSGLPVDDVTIVGGAPVRGTTLSAIDAAYAMFALRTVRRTLSDQLQLYSNTTPDTAVLSTPIDAPPLSAGATPVTATSLLNGTLQKMADLFYDHLTDGTGRAWPGWDVSKSAPTSGDDLLDAHTAAARALFVGYLATGNTKYRDRASAVAKRVDSVFWDAWARMYRTKAGDTSSTITYTPVRFVLLQAMLRDVYELTPTPDATLARSRLDRVARVNKLILNGWDDRNDNQAVDWPQECVAYDAASGIPRGGLQLAERTLSGETGSVADIGDGGVRMIAVDREQDCVPNVASVGLPSALADSVTFTLAPGKP